MLYIHMTNVFVLSASSKLNQNLINRPSSASITNLCVNLFTICFVSIPFNLLFRTLCSNRANVYEHKIRLNSSLIVQDNFKPCNYRIKLMLIYPLLTSKDTVDYICSLPGLVAKMSIHSLFNRYRLHTLFAELRYKKMVTDNLYKFVKLQLWIITKKS